MARLWTCFEGRIQSTCWWKSLALPHSGPPVLSWTLPLLFALLPSLLPIWSQSLNSLIFWFVNDLPVCPWSVYIPPLVLMVSYQLYPRQACAMLLLLIINTSYLCCAFQFRPFGIHYLIWHTRFHGPFHAFHSAPDLREEAWVSFSWISEKLTPWQLQTWQRAPWGTGLCLHRTTIKLKMKATTLPLDLISWFIVGVLNLLLHLFIQSFIQRCQALCKQGTRQTKSLCSWSLHFSRRVRQ